MINNGRKITNFIYNHGWLLAQMRQYCGEDIVRLGATRFATNYIALDNLLKKMLILKYCLWVMDGHNTNSIGQ